MEKTAKKFMKSAKSNFSKAKRSYTCRSLKYVSDCFPYHLSFPRPF